MFSVYQNWRYLAQKTYLEFFKKSNKEIVEKESFLSEPTISETSSDCSTDEIEDPKVNLIIEELDLNHISNGTPIAPITFKDTWNE